MKIIDLLTIERIAVHIHVSDWRDAIQQVGLLMLRSGVIEERYIDAMIRTAEELGPYIVMAPGIAIPHARPEDGVIKPCLALATLEDPVPFGNPDNDPVALLLAFGTDNSKQHTEALAEISRLFTFMFTEYGGIEPFLSVNTSDELIALVLKTNEIAADITQRR